VYKALYKLALKLNF